MMPTFLHQAKMQLPLEFSMTDLGPAEYCLGIQISCDLATGAIKLYQGKHAHGILQCFNMFDARPCANPMEVSYRLTKSMSPPTDEDWAYMMAVPCGQVVGALRYLVTCTCPDLTFSTSQISQFLQYPGLPHWHAIKRIFHYLAGTIDVRLLYGYVFLIPVPLWFGIARNMRLWRFL